VIARFLTFGASSAALDGTIFLTIGLDGAPLVARDQRSSQLYAMKWRAP